MLNIIETKGDVLKSDAIIICHQVNCLGIMGAGLALQIKQKYPQVFRGYKMLCDENQDSPSDLLGHAFIYQIDKNQYIANLFGQLGCGFGIQTDYVALRFSLIDMLKSFFKDIKVYPNRIAIPKYLGCGLAGGDWNIVYKIFEDVLTKLSDENNVDITLEIVEYAKE